MFLKIIGAICETLYGLLKAFALVGILGFVCNRDSAL